jgi:hypothetical protein
MRDAAAAGKAHPPGGLVGNAEFQHLGAPDAMTSIASRSLPPRRSRRKPSPRNCRRESITRWLPTGRGAEPQVSMTVASATRRGPPFPFLGNVERIAQFSIGHIGLLQR